MNKPMLTKEEILEIKEFAQKHKHDDSGTNAENVIKLIEALETKDNGSI